MNQVLKTKSEISQWLKRMHIQNYQLIPEAQYGFVVDVEGDVILGERNLTQIPIQFNQVSGDFFCHDNQLTSLYGSPKSVRGDFGCMRNCLKNLKYSPHFVGGNFYALSNRLTSLEGCPKIVGGSFFCGLNQLKNLDYCPAQVGGDFSCSGNPLLGESQSVLDFSEIKKIHLQQIEIKKEKLKLKKVLPSLENEPSTNSKNYKI